MVAATKQFLTDSPRALPDGLIAGRLSLMRFTVADVLAMMRDRVLAEDSTTELIDGLIVVKDRSDTGKDRRMHGPKHRRCIRMLQVLGSRIETTTRFAQVQLPIIIADDQMPEPDFALVRGTDDDYADSAPRSTDIYCIIEAAASSLESDTVDKLRIYAQSGIPQYLVINLRNNTILQFSNPNPAAAEYREMKTISANESFFLRGGPDGDVEIRATEVLPQLK